VKTAALVLAAAIQACGSTSAGSMQSGSAAELLCSPADCGPALGMPNVLCPDGSRGGPTGRCLRRGGGGCGWEVRECPAPARCGTIAGLACPAGLVCVDAPGDACTYPVDPDCGGVCVNPLFCGGLAAIPCPPWFVCVDDPRDDCRPPTGADCSGLCAPR